MRLIDSIDGFLLACFVRVRIFFPRVENPHTSLLHEATLHNKFVEFTFMLQNPLKRTAKL